MCKIAIGPVDLLQRTSNLTGLGARIGPHQQTRQVAGSPLATCRVLWPRRFAGSSLECLQRRVLSMDGMPLLAPELAVVLSHGDGTVAGDL